MKRILAIGAMHVCIMVAFLSSAVAQSSGVFVGVNAGVPYTVPSYSGALDTMKGGFPKSGIGWAIGLDVGYKHALSEDYGLKYYVDINYSQSKGKKNGGFQTFNSVEADINSLLVTANVDFYYNFTSVVGGYIGLGLGYQSFKPTWKPSLATPPGTTMSFGASSKGGIALPLNIGLNFNISDAHQITLGAKIPLIAYKYDTTLPQQVSVMTGGKTDGTATLRAYIFQVGYNYTF